MCVYINAFIQKETSQRLLVHKREEEKKKEREGIKSCVY